MPIGKYPYNMVIPGDDHIGPIHQSKHPRYQMFPTWAQPRPSTAPGLGVDKVESD